MSIAKNPPQVNGVSVTGRDGPVLCKALAYAITSIERLPSVWQERSDKEDMRTLLAWLVSEPAQADFFLISARSHLDRRGIAIEDGQIILAPRATAEVIPIT